MKYIRQTNNPTIQVSFEMTIEELKALTQGLGATSQSSRVTAGMTELQASACDRFFYTADEACKALGINTND